RPFSDSSKGGPSWNRVVKNRRNLKSVGSRSRSASGSSGWRNASHHRQEATLANMGPAASTTTLESARAPARAASSEARGAGTLSPESVAGLGFDAAETRNPLESARFNDSALTFEEFLPMNATAHHLSPSKAVRFEPSQIIWDLTASHGGSAV